MIGHLSRVCAVVLLAALAAHAQEATPSAPADAAKVTITIEDTTAPPDWELSVPVSVQMAEGVKVGSLAFKMTFPAKAVKYTGVKATESLKSAGLDVKAGTPDVKEDVGTLALEVVRAEGNGPAELPSGRIAIVMFTVAHDAEEGTFAMAAEEVQARTGGAGSAAVAAAAAEPATFTVASAGLPIFACFFYMH
jgi:hypothetical protein